MALNQQFCLRWNNHQSTLISVFDHLLESGTLVDCTLAAEGQFLKAHKVVLSACSPYLEALLSQHYEKHPILILKDVTFHELKSMLDYMYRGEVNITQEQLGTFLKAAESLQIKGLTDSGAISDGREFERSRESDRPRDSSRIDRSIGLGLPVPKRMEMRKQISRSRSPLFGLPPNLIMNVENKKVGKHTLLQEINSSSPTVTRNREGSLSPTIKRKRSYPPYVPQSEEPNVYSNPIENNNHEENHKVQNKSKESLPVLESINSVPLINNPKMQISKQTRKTESDSLVISDIIKHEMKTENVDFPDDVLNDDSVGDLTVEEEEEEMDEADLTKPGPSNAPNSHVAGIPWHIAGEGNGEDLLLASQQESQESPMRSALACVKCHKTYSSPHTLRRHVRLECGQEPRFICPYCPHRTKQRYNLMLHIGRTHRDVLSQVGVSLDK